MPLVLTKICYSCKQEKSLDKFHVDNTQSDGRQGKCKECRRPERRKYYLQDKEQILKKQCSDYKNPRYKKKRWAIRLKHLWGLSIKEYEEIYNKQNGVCAICSQPEIVVDKWGNIKRLSIDHNHRTKKIRKLLCDHCNRGLGYFYDNSTLLLKASLYLKEFE